MDGRRKGGMCVVLVFIMVAAILAFTPAPVAAAVSVDGVITGTEWDTPLLKVVDTVDAPGTAPPGYNLTEVRATIEGNTLYCLMLVVGVAGDADENGNPDTTYPTDYPGVGGGTATFGWEEYNFYIDADNDGTNDYWLRYTWDKTLLTAPGSSVDLVATTAGAFGGNVVEVSLANADTWIDVADFCVAGAADTDRTGAEDYSDKVCWESKPPTFDFNWYGTGCYLVEFTGSWTGDAGVTIASHTWDYGDGATEGPIAGPPGTVSHRYETCGKKTVKLSGYDSKGNYAETVKQIDVQCGPTAIASANPNCIPDESFEVTFDGSKSHSNSVYDIIYWQWNFSDGTSAMGKVVTKVVTDSITATLTVMDEQMCEDTAVVKVGPCSEVPLVTPLGLIALIGALGAMLLVGIRRKVH